MEPAPKLDQVLGADVKQLPSEADPSLIVNGEQAYSPGQFLTAAPESGTPEGFLLKVVSSQTSGGDTEVVTEPGSLYEAVPNGEIEAGLGDLGSAHALNADARKLSRAIGRSTGTTEPKVPFDQKVKCEKSEELTLTGSLTTSVAPHLSMKWHKFLGVPVGIDKAKATLDASVEAEAEGTVSGEDKCTLTPITLFDPEWETIVEVGGVPVPVTVSVPIVLTGSAGVSGSVSVKATAEAHGSLGVAYEHGELTGIHEFSSEANIPEPTVKAKATVEAEIGPNATITAGWQVKHLGGVAATIGVNVSSGLRLTYELLVSPPGTLCVPLEVSGSIALELPFDTIEKSKKLYEGNIRCVQWGETTAWSGVISAKIKKKWKIDEQPLAENVQTTEYSESSRMIFDGRGKVIGLDGGGIETKQPFEWTGSTDWSGEVENGVDHYTWTIVGSGSGAQELPGDAYRLLLTPISMGDAALELGPSLCGECVDEQYLVVDHESGIGNGEPFDITTEPQWPMTRPGVEGAFPAVPGSQAPPEALVGPFSVSTSPPFMMLTGSNTYRWSFVGAGVPIGEAEFEVDWNLTRLPDEDHDGTPNIVDDCPSVFDDPQNPGACGT